MSDVRDPDRDQALPIPNDGPSAHDLVIADMEERKAHGLKKYGNPLQPNNGRSQVRDAYEEVLDLAAYLRAKLEEESETQALLEREGASWEEVDDYRLIGPDDKVYAESGDPYELRQQARAGDRIEQLVKRHATELQWRTKANLT